MPKRDDHFYLYLPSSTISTGKINTRNNFTINFCTPIELNQGNEFEYEVALIKFIYPSKILNVYNGKLMYYSYVKHENIQVTIPNGTYVLPDGFIKSFYNVLGLDAKYYTLGADIKNQNFVLDCITPNSQIKPLIEISDNLAALTGLPKIINKIGYVHGDTWDITGGANNIYIYSDLVTSTHIGNTTAPILSVISFDANASKEQIEFEPLNPIYTSVNKQIFHSIEVELRTKTGEYFPFRNFGETLLVLHIRPKQYGSSI